MIRFAEVYPDETIVSTLSRQLCWSLFPDLISIDVPLKRNFSTGMSRSGGRRDEVDGDVPEPRGE